MVASKPGVYALERGRKKPCGSFVVRRKDYASSEDFDAAAENVERHNIDLVVLWRAFCPCWSPVSLKRIPAAS